MRKQSTLNRVLASVTAVAFVGLTSGSAVLAAPPPPTTSKKVALFVVPKAKASADDAKVLQSVMRAELARMVGIRPVSGSGEAPMSVSQVLVPDIETGFRALDAKTPGPAQEAFEKAYKNVLQFQGPVDRRLLARVLKGLGSARIMNGQVDEGKEALETGLNVWPNQQLGEYGWTLDLRTAFNEVQDDKARSQPGSIEVSVEPAGAAVRVDGQLRGFAPVTVGELPAGKHWVEVQLDGYRWANSFVEVPSGDSTIHSVELDATGARAVFEAQDKALEKALTKGSAAGPMADLQRTLGADQIIVLVVSAGGNAYAFDGWSRQTGDPVKLNKSIPDNNSFATKVRAWLAEIVGSQPTADDSDLPLDQPPTMGVGANGDLIIDPNDPIFRTDDNKDDNAITGKWWFWAVVGGVTAGLVGGGYALLSASGEGSGPAGQIRVDVGRLP